MRHVRETTSRKLRHCRYLISMAVIIVGNVQVLRRFEVTPTTERVMLSLR